MEIIHFKVKLTQYTALLKTRPINTLLDMWPESYFNMLKQKYLAVKPLDGGVDH